MQSVSVSVGLNKANYLNNAVQTRNKQMTKEVKLEVIIITIIIFSKNWFSL